MRVGPMPVFILWLRFEVFFSRPNLGGNGLQFLRI